MRIKPRGALLLVEKQPKGTEITAGGVQMPPEWQDHFCQAIIRDIGPGCQMDSGGRAVVDDLNIGDLVLVEDNPPRGPQGQKRGPDHMIPVGIDKPLFLVSEARCAAILKDDDTIGAIA